MPADQLHIPIEWMFAMLGFMLTGLGAYIARLERRNSQAHGDMQKRIDHIILHHQPTIPRYVDDETGD